MAGGDSFHVPTALSPTGEQMLVVLADVGGLANREAGSRFFELDAYDVIKLAASQNAGIIVQSSLPGRGAWAGIPKADVRRLMLDRA